MRATSDRVAGHVAIITGGTRDVGMAIAEHLVAEATRVAITRRNPEGVVKAVQQLGGQAHAIGPRPCRRP